jgi:hypothetical protein
MTMDNAENNNVLLKELELLLKARNIDFVGADEARIMCFPHVINVCCKGAIMEFKTNLDLADEDEDSLETQKSISSGDSIARGRVIVKKIKASGNRTDNFEQTIKDGNSQGWFFTEENPDEPMNVQVPMLKLVHDVKTRWDSLFFMLQRLQELKPVSILLLQWIIRLTVC